MVRIQDVTSKQINSNYGRVWADSAKIFETKSLYIHKVTMHAII